LIEVVLHTINDRGQLVTDTLDLVTNVLNLVTDTGHSSVDAKRDIRNSPHPASIVYSMRGL